MSRDVFGTFRFLSISAAVLISVHGLSLNPVRAGEAQYDVNSGSSSLPVHGVVRASQQATITTDLMARVSSIGFKEGQRFNKATP